MGFAMKAEASRPHSKRRFWSEAACCWFGVDGWLQRRFFGCFEFFSLRCIEVFEAWVEDFLGGVFFAFSTNSRNPNMKRNQSIQVLLAVLSPGLLSTAATGALVFSSNFDDGTTGAVDDIGDLGAPAVGTWAFENAGTASYGFVSAGVDRAFTTGNDANTRVTIPAADGPLNTAFQASPGSTLGNQSVDNRLFANFAASDLTGGNSATVSFDIGSFGTQNSGAFKAVVVRGLSAAGGRGLRNVDRFGKWGEQTRFIYAREGGDTTYLRTAFNAGTPEGTRVFSGIPGFNSTNNASPPGNLNTIDITLANGEVTYSSSGGNADATLTFGQNSAATEISQLEFTSVNFNQNGNSGYWLDNVTVDSVVVPEPTTALLGGLGLLTLLRRRRG